MHTRDDKAALAFPTSPEQEALYISHHGSTMTPTKFFSPPAAFIDPAVYTPQ